MKHLLSVPLLLLSLAACGGDDDQPPAAARGDSAQVEAEMAPAASAASAPADSHAHAHEPHPVEALLPRGTVRAEVLGMQVPPRLGQLMAKMQTAAAGDAQWFEAYVKEHGKPGEPLPYDPRLGLTEAEYRELVGLAEQMQLQPVAQTDLSFRRERDGRWVVDGGSGAPELTGIVIDVARDQVETPLGVATQRRAVTPAPEQRAAGPWSGVQWTHSQADPSTRSGTVIAFALGRLQEDGRGVLYYEARQVEGGQMRRQNQIVLRYNLPR